MLYNYVISVNKTRYCAKLFSLLTWQSVLLCRLYFAKHSVATRHTEHEAQLLLRNSRSYANHHDDNKIILSHHRTIFAPYTQNGQLINKARYNKWVKFQNCACGEFDGRVGAGVKVVTLGKIAFLVGTFDSLVQRLLLGCSLTTVHSVTDRQTDDIGT